MDDEFWCENLRRSLTRTRKGGGNGNIEEMEVEEKDKEDEEENERQGKRWQRRSTVDDQEKKGKEWKGAGRLRSTKGRTGKEGK